MGFHSFQMNPSDDGAFEDMREMFGPAQIDTQIRQAIHFCWMGLPRTNVTLMNLNGRFDGSLIAHCGMYARISMSSLATRMFRRGHPTEHGGEAESTSRQCRLRRARRIRSC